MLVNFFIYATKNDVTINEDIFVIILENLFLEKSYQEELDILINKIRENNLGERELNSQSISTIILTISFIIAKNKIKYTNNRSDIESKIEMIIKNILNQSSEIKDITEFSMNFAEDY